MKVTLKKTTIVLALSGLALLPTVISVNAGCGFGNKDPDCQPPGDVQGCTNKTNQKPCPYVLINDNTVGDVVCNTKYKDYTSTDQFSCQSGMLGIECDVNDGPCGSFVTGGCTAGQPNECTATASIGIITKGESVYYNTICNEVDGGSPTDQPGGEVATQSHSDDCNAPSDPSPAI